MRKTKKDPLSPAAWASLKNSVIKMIKYNKNLVHVCDEGGDLHGWCGWTTGGHPVVSVCGDQSRDEIISTYIHEITHLCIQKLDFSMSDKEEEHICDQMAECLKESRLLGKRLINSIVDEFCS